MVVLSDDVKKKIKESARNLILMYTEQENTQDDVFNTFLGNTGWQDWMNEYIKDYEETYECKISENEELPERITSEIDKDLEELFNEVYDEIEICEITNADGDREKLTVKEIRENIDYSIRTIGEAVQAVKSVYLTENWELEIESTIYEN